MRESLAYGKMQNDVDRTVAIATEVASSTVPSDVGVAGFERPVRMAILEWRSQKRCGVLKEAVLIGKSPIS